MFKLDLNINVPAATTSRATTSVLGNEERKESPRRIAVTTLSSQTLESIDQPAQPQIVIPLIKQNRWYRSQSKSSDQMIDSLETNDASTVKTESVEESLQHLSEADRKAALELLRESGEVKNGPSIVIPLESGVNEKRPLLMQNKVPGIEECDNDSDALRLDLENRPELDQDQYNRVGVSDFADALLAGMNWKEGDPIGLSNAGIVKPMDVQARDGRQGLGASASTRELQRKRKRNEPQVVSTPGSAVASLLSSSRVIVHESLRLRPGALVEVVSDDGLVDTIDGSNSRRHALRGQYGRVVDVSQQSQLTVAQISMLSEGNQVRLNNQTK